MEEINLEDVAQELRARLIAMDRIQINLRYREFLKYGLTKTEVLRCWDSVHHRTKIDEKPTARTNLIREYVVWPHHVEVKQLILECKSLFEQLIVFRCEEHALACALWAVATWFVENLGFAPYLMITAPTKRCGKTQLLIALSKLSKDPLLASSQTSSTVFRLLNEHSYTIFFDELENNLEKNNELVAVLNGGNCRDTAVVFRTERNELTGEYTPIPFQSFGFKAFAGINSKGMRDTLTDRSIVIDLRRRISFREEVIKMRDIPPNKWNELNAKCFRVATDYASEKIDQARWIPAELNDRQGDVWCPLLGLARLAGEEFFVKVRDCAIKMCSFSEDETSLNLELLRDIQDALELFPEKLIMGDFVLTNELLVVLNSQEDWRWKAILVEEKLSGKKLSLILGSFSLVPLKVRSAKNNRGYRLSRIEEEIERYLTTTKKFE